MTAAEWSTDPDSAALEVVRARNAEVIERYVLAQGTRWRAATTRVRRLQLAAYARAVEPVPIEEVSEEDVMAYYDGLTGTAETRNAYRSMLRGFYRWLQVKARPRVREDDPTELLDRPTRPRALPRPMFTEDYRHALACAVADRTLYVWLALMGCCGLRCCEVAWLRKVDVQRRPDGTGRLHVTGKGGHTRVVPVGTDLMALLVTFLDTGSTRGPVFRRVSDGGAHHPNRVSARVNDYLRSLGIPATAHQLRHLFGTEYHAMDHDVFRQADVMGHASVDMTRRYSAVNQTEAAVHVETLTRQMLDGTALRVARSGAVR